MYSGDKNTWNVVSETTRREHGFCVPSLFNRRCYRSPFIVQRMGLINYLDGPNWTACCANFNQINNLICTGDNSRRICIFDWLSGQLKYNLRTKHSGCIYDVKFLNTNGNGADVISACGGGQVRHTCIAPTGHSISKRIFLNTDQRHRLLTVPHSPMEFVAVSRNSGIFQIDLRSERWSPVPDAIVSSEKSAFLPINDAAHHPFASEICICGHDAYLQIFDKRNLKNTVQRIVPKNFDFNNENSNVNRCVYNYDGSEILANYQDLGTFIFENKSDQSGDFLQFYGENLGFDPFEVQFFGEKSEYIIKREMENIIIEDKLTQALIARLNVGSTFSVVTAHPFLPVLAIKSGAISVWAPTQIPRL